MALKIPKDQEKGEEILRKESDIIRDIHHPNIVSLYGYHNVSELFVIEMEYVDGHNLADVLDGVSRRSPLTFKQMLEWTLQTRVATKRLRAEAKVHEAIGRLKERYPRVARYYTITYDSATAAVTWTEQAGRKADAVQLDGTYVLKTDRHDLTDDEIWRLYMLLTYPLCRRIQGEQTRTLAALGAPMPQTLAALGAPDATADRTSSRPWSPHEAARSASSASRGVDGGGPATTRRAMRMGR